MTFSCRKFGCAGCHLWALTLMNGDFFASSAARIHGKENENLAMAADKGEQNEISSKDSRFKPIESLVTRYPVTQNPKTKGQFLLASLRATWARGLPTTGGGVMAATLWALSVGFPGWTHSKRVLLHKQNDFGCENETWCRPDPPNNDRVISPSFSHHFKCLWNVAIMSWFLGNVFFVQT